MPPSQPARRAEELRKIAESPGRRVDKLEVVQQWLAEKERRRENDEISKTASTLKVQRWSVRIRDHFEDSGTMERLFYSRNKKRIHRCLFRKDAISLQRVI